METFAGLLSILKKLGDLAHILLSYVLDFWQRKQTARRAIVDQWKYDLLANEIYCGDRTGGDRTDVFIKDQLGFVGPEISYLRLIKRPSYPYFAEHLSTFARTELQRWNGNRHMTLIRGGAEPPVRKIVAGEIRRIERAWRLI